MSEKLVSLYVDVPLGYREVKVDDFIVAIGKTKSNSVYHVAEVKIRGRGKPPHRIIRYYVKCFRSDLLTCCRRDKETQNVIDVTWYKRNKKSVR